MSGRGQGFKSHEGPRAAPGRAAFSQTQKRRPGEGDREDGGDDFKVQGPSACECRGGNQPRGPAQTLAVALPRRGTRATSHLRASLSSSVRWE